MMVRAVAAGWARPNRCKPPATPKSPSHRGARGGYGWGMS